MPSSPATTMSVFELATIEPGTLPPVFKWTTACGPPADWDVADASALGLGGSVLSFFEHEESNITLRNARNGMLRITNYFSYP